MGTLYKDQYSCLIISLSVLLRMRNFSDKSCRENRHFTFKNSFGNRAVYEIIWKNIVERGRPQTTIWRIRISCWIPKALNIHSECVILISFPTAKRVARTRLSIMLFIHCLLYILFIYLYYIFCIQ